MRAWFLTHTHPTNLGWDCNALFDLMRRRVIPTVQFRARLPEPSLSQFAQGLGGLTLSLSSQLDDEAIAFDSKSAGLALRDDARRLVGRAERHEASSLRLALVVEQEFDLANVQLHVVEGLGKAVLVGGHAQVSHVDRVHLSGLLLVGGLAEAVAAGLGEAAATATSARVRVGGSEGS